MTPYPKLVALLVTNFNAWIVGSAAKLSTDLTTVRDWDVIVPFSEWSKAASLIPVDAKVNRFGGWKCISEGQTVDVWPDDLHFLENVMCKYIWHPRSGKRYASINHSVEVP